MKPVAYISDGGVIFKESPPDSILKLSPLYTSAEIQELHNLVKELPMRELTDKEMLEVYKNLFNKKNEFKENLKRKSYFDFARAILQKASEQ
jgi:hypothetical protein